MKTFSKTTRPKRLRIPFTTNLRRHSISGMHQSMRTYVLLFLQTVKTYIYRYIFFSVPPVCFWSGLYQKNTTSFSDLQDCFIWTWKYISKLPGEKSYIYHPERIVCDTLFTIHGFPPCLAANKPHYDDQHSRNTPLKAHLRTLISPTRQKYIFQSHQSPSGPVYTRKTLQVFQIYKTVRFEHENTFQNYLAEKATYTIQNESWMIHCPPYTASHPA